jgi:hypothetical protein
VSVAALRSVERLLEGLEIERPLDGRRGVEVAAERLTARPREHGVGAGDRVPPVDGDVARAGRHRQRLVEPDPAVFLGRGIELPHVRVADRSHAGEPPRRDACLGRGAFDRRSPVVAVLHGDAVGRTHGEFVSVHGRETGGPGLNLTRWDRRRRTALPLGGERRVDAARTEPAYG